MVNEWKLVEATGKQAEQTCSKWADMCRQVSKWADMCRKSSQAVTKSKEVAIEKKQMNVRKLADKSTKDCT